MTEELDPILGLTSGFRLGDGHEEQERVVAAALRRLLVEDRRGVVLADEVGFGKTYEALAVLAHLCTHRRRTRKRIEYALVLCKKVLVRKWEEETSSTREGKGFPRYLPPGHAAVELFRAENVRCIDKRATARELRRSGVRGQRVDGRNQVPPGLYIVNERLLLEEKREASTLLRQIWNSRWDVVIVDEAHHYARGNRPMELFAPNRDLRNYEQGLEFDKILALTATPFELTPHELVDLLALVRADRSMLETIEEGLRRFVGALDRFFELRERSPTDALRRQQVELLESLRDRDALGAGAQERGLQRLLRQFLIRNTKSQNERRYFLTERVSEGFQAEPFAKLDEDLRERIRRSRLIPFEGEHALFYLELRGLIQEVTERARDDEHGRTFIPTDLRQGLSSYRQIAESHILNRDLDGARRLRALVTGWNRLGKLHPKVDALAVIVRDIVAAEVRKVREHSGSWFSKILVFNKLIRGTAFQLRQVLQRVVENALDEFLGEFLAARGTSRGVLASRARDAVDHHLDLAEEALKADARWARWRCVPHELESEELARFRGRSILRMFREPLRRRAGQTLALIDLAREVDVLTEASIRSWIEHRLTRPVVQCVHEVIERYLDDSTPSDTPREVMLERAARELEIELEETKSVDIIGRFDGESKDRDAHRRNFNLKYNPFILLVSQVGEEGIDLQEQCRYVIHYDLEWNPARMEQREGRVDRLGWGRASEAFIDVRFMLLKGTYEERIFHTVMQRDQWFQILIGSKRKELGILPKDVDDEVEQDRVTEDEAAGALTDAEKARIMLDLRPE